MLIRGKRVTIRNFELSDFDDYYEFSKHPDVGYNAGWKPHPNQDISRKILHSNIMSLCVVLKNCVPGARPVLLL